MASPSAVEDILCGDDKQESQGKRSSLIAVRHPHKEHLLLSRVSPFCSEVSHPNGATIIAITNYGSLITDHQLRIAGLDSRPEEYCNNQLTD